MSRQFELAFPSPSFPSFLFHSPSANCFSTLFFSENHFLLTVDQSQTKAERACLSHVNSRSPWWRSVLSFCAFPLPQPSSTEALPLWGSRPGHQRQDQTQPLQFHQGSPDSFISSLSSCPQIPPATATPHLSLGLIWEMQGPEVSLGQMECPHQEGRAQGLAETWAGWWGWLDFLGSQRPLLWWDL